MTPDASRRKTLSDGIRQAAQQNDAPRRGVSGSDRVIVRDNHVVGNDSGGIAVLAPAFPNPDPRVDPLPDGNHVRSNVALANGRSPDPLRSPFPGADLIYDGTGSGTCFADNIFASSIPTALELLFGCV